MMGMIGRTGVVGAGGFTPSGSPIGHWSADTIEGLSDGEVVATWPDQSGNGNDLVQANAAKKPTFQSDAASLQNGLPVVRFDGVDDGIECGIATTQPETVFLVIKPISSTNNDYLVEGVGGYVIFWQRDGTSLVELYAGNLNNVQDVLVPGTCAIVTLLANGASSFIRRDGVERDSGDAGATNMAGLDLGAARGHVDIAHALMYDGAEAPADNESGLNTKWAVF